MNPNELRIKKAAVIAQAEAVNDTLTDFDLSLTDDQRATQQTKYDELLAEAKDYEAKAKAIEDNEAAARKRADELAALTSQSGPQQQTTPDPPKVPDVEAKPPNFEDDPMKGFKSHTEFFGAVMLANPDYPHTAKDERLRFLATAGTDEQQVGSPAYGGFLVPEAVMSLQSGLPLEPDPFVGKTSNLPMDRPVVNVPAISDKTHTTSVSGGLTVSRSSETASKTASRMKLEKVIFTAHSLFGFSYATEELMQDSPTTVFTLLSQGYGKEFASNHINELLTGTGVGQFEGVQANPALITVNKENEQVVDTIVFQNIVNMTARCYGYGSAFWIYNHNCYPQLKTLVLPVGTSGVPLWETASTVINGNAETVSLLNGRPAFSSEYAETVGDLHDIMLIVPSAIHEGTYQPLKSAESMHIRFDRHERAFKFWTRNDARSLWRAALTPKNGSTLSPFVTLQARA